MHFHNEISTRVLYITPFIFFYSIQKNKYSGVDTKTISYLKNQRKIVQSNEQKIMLRIATFLTECIGSEY